MANSEKLIFLTSLYKWLLLEFLLNQKPSHSCNLSYRQLIKTNCTENNFHSGLDRHRGGDKIGLIKLSPQFTQNYFLFKN